MHVLFNLNTVSSIAGPESDSVFHDFKFSPGSPLSGASFARGGTMTNGVKPSRVLIDHFIVLDAFFIHVFACISLYFINALQIFPQLGV